MSTKPTPTCINGHLLTRANKRVTGGHERKYTKCRLCANEASRRYLQKLLADAGRKKVQ